MPGPRDYRPSEIKRLCIVSNNQCFNPVCDNKLIATDAKTVIGKISHIEAASPEGPRYRLAMTDDDRRSYDNLLLLCDGCHSVIDNKVNEVKYTTELLKSWKEEHEKENDDSSFDVSDENVGSVIDHSITVTNNALAISQFDLSKSSITSAHLTSSSNIIQQTFNSYDSAHHEHEDSSAIKELFENALALMKADSFDKKATDVSTLMHTLEKIQLNFQEEADENEVRTYFTNSFSKKIAIEQYLRSFEPEEQEDFQNHILAKYSSIKDEFSSIEVLRKLFILFVPKGKEDDPKYENLAKAYVLLFFEDCTIFLKTAKENAKARDLFSDI